MATNTTNYSFKKPDESDFYDVQDQNGNWDKADEALKSLDTPTFEDYTGSTPVPAANTAIDGIKSKTKLSALMSNIKAAFKGACLIGHIVNNCVTNNPNLPLSAAQGKVLMDLYTQLNGDLYKWLNVTRLDTGNDVNGLSSPSLAYSYSTASHAPFDDISANILTIGIDGYKAQIAFGVSRDSVQVKVRTSYDFVWQGWRSVTLS